MSAPKAAKAISEPLSTSGRLFFGGLCAGTFGLGCWQVARLQRKLDAVDKRDAELAMEPTRDLYAESFRRRLVSGTFRHDHQVLVGPRGAPPGARLPRTGLSAKKASSSGGSGTAPGPQGYYVWTPLELTSDGDEWKEAPVRSAPVWVNRGWVPKTAVDRGLGWDCPTGRVQLTAVRSKPEHPRFMTPDHEYDKRPPRMFYIDEIAMQDMISDASESQSEEDPLVLLTTVDTDANDDNDEVTYPVASPLASVGEFKTSPAIHVGYAATWFGLSGAGVYMTRKMILRGRGG